jgi:hypothetical protein
MKIVLSFVLLAIAVVSCTNNTSPVIALPAKPASAEAVSELVKGKSFETKKVATLSPFATDKESPYEWMNDATDTSKFFRDYLKERMGFTLQFLNDTSTILNDGGKLITGTYKFDSNVLENEKEGVKLRISYPDESMNFPGMSGAMIMTSTYLIAGADEKNLLIETPRSFNNRRVAVLMQVK